MQGDRSTEWFVPKFGSKNFRLTIGILFLPYTAMMISFAIWGSLSVEFSLDRIAAIGLLYFFSVGISAHCLDALGSKKKPWGEISRTKLWTASIISLIISCAIGLYYVFLDSWLLFPIGVAEGFFLFAYNLELFRGKFHNNASFVISWGILPVLAGAVIQNNTISIETIIFSAIAGLASYILIITSRKYKILKQQNENHEKYHKKEFSLKMICSVVIIITVCFFILRYL
jgi:4-hydroxybenzoate polyprenyltransferase